MNSPKRPIPGIEQAQDYLGLSLNCIAQAVGADESTLYRWHSSGVLPSPLFLARLNALDDLVSEMKAAFADGQTARDWLHEPLPGMEMQTPAALVAEGKAEFLVGWLYAMNSGMSM